MTRRVQQTAWLVLGIGLVVCSSRAWSYRQANLATRAQAREVAVLADGVRHDVLTLRNVMQEATVVGRSADWSAAVDQPLSVVKKQLEAWRDREAHAGAKVQVESALNELAALQQNAVQAHDFLDNNQRTLANEVVLADGAQLSNALYTRLSDAQRLSLDALDRAGAQTGRTEATLFVALVALGALGFLALAPVVFRREDDSSSPAATAALGPEISFDATGHSAAQSPFALGEDASPQPSSAATAPSGAPATVSAETAERGAMPDTSASERPPTVGAAATGVPLPLGEVARLCTEFARVKERQELEGLLDRAMHVLDARGLIVWHPVGDRALRPVLARGYGSKTLARIPDMPLSDNGVFAGAYRSGELRVIAGRNGDFGALILPMLAAEGCLGLVTLELRSGESSDAVQAVGRILVAQLATIVAPEGSSAQTANDTVPAAATNSLA